MSKFHRVYLNLGSNIRPRTNLPKAVRLLRKYGQVRKVSSAWESKSVGASGPNYLNACVLFISPLPPVELKEKIIRPIEAQLGRVRGLDKYAPRTIDIDIVLFDEKPFNQKFWKFPFVIIPLAEIHPEYHNPVGGESLRETATRLRQLTWIETRPGVLD